MDMSKFKMFEEQAEKTIYAEPELTFHRKLIPQMVMQFLPAFNLNLDDKILDVGCGPGVFLQEMKDLHYTDVTGVTLSNEDYDICIDKGLSCKFNNLSDIDEPSGSIDFIWCRHSFEHSPYPLFTLFEFNRLLKDGGKMYVEVPAPDSDRLHEYNDNHFSVLGGNMLNALFAKAGFKILFSHALHFDITVELVPARETYFVYGVEKCTKLFPK